VVLIRPDGYIALISDAGDVSVVSDYLAAMSASEILMHGSTPSDKQSRSSSGEQQADPKLVCHGECSPRSTSSSRSL